MLQIKTMKQTPFVALSAVHIVSACIILVNEILSIPNRVPGGNFPIEHKFSWARVLLFCGIGIASALILGVLATEKLWQVFPSLKLILLIATFATFMSVIFNYPSVTGWCCEVSPTRYFGFPFSFLSGDSVIDALPIPSERKIIHFQFPYIPVMFLVDILFWSNLAFIVLSFISLLAQKAKNVSQERKERHSSETS